MKLDLQEPRDGDFVAYLDLLERRQVAALNLEQRLGGELPASPAPPAAADTRVSTTAGQAGAAAATATPPSVAVALVIGAVLLLTTFVGDGNVVTFFIGAALLAWALRRLVRRAPERAARARQQAMARIDAALENARKR